mmetsp:Transcript_5124/g.9188  ORF Transcript_5124/g.9188 Transcript_5124/m.9188 type:complete len:214 (+) Transcript_5124:30-671(+)
MVSDVVYRRGAEDERGVATQVVYRPMAQDEGGPAWERSVEQVRVFRRDKATTEVIMKRKGFKRFGAAKGAVGPERGISMRGQDVVTIEDPLGEDASKTGEDRLIERLKSTVKSKGTHRQEGFGSDFDSYVSSRTASASKYRQSPNSYRNNSSPAPHRGGPSPGRGYRGQGPREGGRSSPAFPSRNGRNSNPRTPARAGGFPATRMGKTPPPAR